MSTALVPTPTGDLVVPHAPPDGAPSVRLSLVVPTYNESKNIPVLVGQLEALLGPVLGESYEFIVVDDDSADRTWEVALALAETHPRVRVVRRVSSGATSESMVMHTAGHTASHSLQAMQRS